MLRTFPKIILILVMMLIITTHTILNINATSATQVTNISTIRQEQPLKQGSTARKKEALQINPASLILASALSPGITLLKVSYCANEKGVNLEQWFILFWSIAIIDFFVDKIPGLASFFQFIQHPIIWLTVYLAITSPASVPLTVFVALVGTIVLGIRQFYTLIIDSTTLGVGAPVRSILEDIVTVIIILTFC